MVDLKVLAPVFFYVTIKLSYQSKEKGKYHAKTDSIRENQKYRYCGAH